MGSIVRWTKLGAHCAMLVAQEHDVLLVVRAAPLKPWLSNFAPPLSGGGVSLPLPNKAQGLFHFFELFL